MSLCRIEKKRLKLEIEEMKMLNDFVSWMNKGKINYDGSYGYQMTKKLKLKDGTEMSVQASSRHYCEPREILPYSEYSEFEIGFPTEVFGVLKCYAEDDSNYTDTVYPYVPKKVIEYVVRLCGGVIGFACDRSFKYIKVKRNGKSYFQKVWSK